MRSKITRVLFWGVLSLQLVSIEIDTGLPIQPGIGIMQSGIFERGADFGLCSPGVQFSASRENSQILVKLIHSGSVKFWTQITHSYRECQILNVNYSSNPGVSDQVSISAHAFRDFRKKATK